MTTAIQFIEHLLCARDRARVPLALFHLSFTKTLGNGINIALIIISQRMNPYTPSSPEMPFLLPTQQTHVFPQDPSSSVCSSVELP